MSYSIVAPTCLSGGRSELPASDRRRVAHIRRRSRVPEEPTGVRSAGRDSTGDSVLCWTKWRKKRSEERLHPNPPPQPQPPPEPLDPKKKKNHTWIPKNNNLEEENHVILDPGPVRVDGEGYNL